MLRKKGRSDADDHRDFQPAERWGAKAEGDLYESLCVDPLTYEAIIDVGMNGGSHIDRGDGRGLFGKIRFRRSIEEREVMNPRPKTSIRRSANQALQTTSVTRSVFGKVSVSDRHRLGV